jgi:hypothetical protein
MGGEYFIELRLTYQYELTDVLSIGHLIIKPKALALKIEITERMKLI